MVWVAYLCGYIKDFETKEEISIYNEGTSMDKARVMTWTRCEDDDLENKLFKSTTVTGSYCVRVEFLYPDHFDPHSTPEKRYKWFTLIYESKMWKTNKQDVFIQTEVMNRVPDIFLVLKPSYSAQARTDVLPRLPTQREPRQTAQRTVSTRLQEASIARTAGSRRVSVPRTVRNPKDRELFTAILSSVNAQQAREIRQRLRTWPIIDVPPRPKPSTRLSQTQVKPRPRPRPR